VLNWADDLDTRDADQVLELARLPIVHHHIALMADAHLGIGATIGSVFGASTPSFPRRWEWISVAECADSVRDSSRGAW